MVGSFSVDGKREEVWGFWVPVKGERKQRKHITSLGKDELESSDLWEAGTGS